jgi:flagellar biogenesis protein FliO
MNQRTIAQVGRGLILVIAFAAALSAGLAAQTGPPPQGAAETSQGAAGAAAAASRGWLDVAPLVIKTIGGAGLVICLILVGFMAFRKLAPGYAARRPADRVLRLIESLPMGDKRNLVLVQAGARKLLLACVPGQITLLTPLAEGAAASGMESGPSGEADLPGQAAAGFRRMYELERQPASPRPAARTVLSSDLRGKMHELRKALES